MYGRYVPAGADEQELPLFNSPYGVPKWRTLCTVQSMWFLGRWYAGSALPRCQPQDQETPRSYQRGMGYPTLPEARTGPEICQSGEYGACSCQRRAPLSDPHFLPVASQMPRMALEALGVAVLPGWRWGKKLQCLGEKHVFYRIKGANAVERMT